MHKMKLLVAGLCLGLAACGTQNDTDQSEEKDPKSNTEQVKQEPEHHKEVKDGVTYVDDILIVNADHPLPEDYNPGEDPKAKKALNQLLEDGNQEGLNLFITSGFRSYQYQEQVFNEYVQRDGKAAAKKYSAEPGTSEHQSGLAFDIGSQDAPNNFDQSFAETNAGKWIKNHAHEYGFIVRYPEGKEDITGYQYEPWHLRYVGKSDAAKIKDSGKALEEYVGLDEEGKEK